MLRFFTLLVSLALGVLGPAWATSVDKATPEVVRIGILATVGRTSSERLFDATLAALRASPLFKGTHFVVSYYDIRALERALAEQKLDFFIANPGFFSVAQSRYGARHLATQRPVEAEDPNAALGGVFLVRSDRTDLQTLADLKDKVAVTVTPQAFGGWYIALGEIAAHRDIVSQLPGGRPEALFRETRFTGYPMQKVLQTLLTDPTVDVGLVRTCLLEEALESGRVAPGTFRVLNEKKNRPGEPALACRRSTDLYPGWVFATTKRAGAAASKNAAAVLLTMPVSDVTGEWSIANDFLKVDNLYRTLAVEHYAYLREFDWKRLLERYWPLIALALCLLLGGVVHAVHVERVVQRKTLALRQALRLQRETEARAAEAAERLSRWQKAGLMNMLCNLVAHELKQPLGVIANYTGGLRDWARRLSASERWPDLAALMAGLEEIEQQNRRAADIIDEVRRHARGSQTPPEAVTLAALLDAASASVRTLGLGSAELCVAPPPEVTLFVHRMDVELVLVNLLQNAVRAAKSASDNTVDVSFETRPGAVEIHIRNHGTLPEDIAQRLFEPKRCGASASGGLGFGLALCAQLLEKEGGRLELRETDGLVLARVVLPISNRSE